MEDLAIKCFLSYHREDNVEAFPGVIDRFYKELLGQLKAESAVSVEVFRDVAAMVGGEDWRQHLRSAIADTLLFIPVVTARYFQSPVCLEELNTFRKNTPPDELKSAILPVILAGHRTLRRDSPQEEARFIESLHCRDLREAYRDGYDSPTWRNLIGQVVDDILTWHEGYGGRHETIQMQAQGGFRLDDQFLEDLGLGALPPELRQQFLQHVYTELEMRVGERLTENMSDEKLDEFGAFVDTDMAGMESWYATYLPAYREMENFKQLKQANPAAPDSAVMAEFGAMMWLGMNRPDYPLVVGAVLEELKQEIRDNRDEIISGATGAVDHSDADEDGEDTV